MVAQYYGREGMAERLLTLARKGAANMERLTVKDLALYDDMHIGGRAATEHLLGQLYLAPGMKLLDIGSGIGGAARFVAETYNVHVTGIDLTPQYKDTAEELGRAVGMEDRTAFVTGSALEMPFEDETFDAAYTIHVGMNIQDKKTLYGEAFRVLKPGGMFGVYDVMAGPEADKMEFPVPWAETQVTSFLRTPKDIESDLTGAGFKIIARENRGTFGLQAIQKMREMQEAGKIPEKLYPIQSEKFPVKLHYLRKNMEKGYCAPWEIVCRKE